MINQIEKLRQFCKDNPPMPLGKFVVWLPCQAVKLAFNVLALIVALIKWRWRRFWL